MRICFAALAVVAAACDYAGTRPLEPYQIVLVSPSVVTGVVGAPVDSAAIVRVVAPDGQPVANTRLTVFREAGVAGPLPPISLTTDGDGRTVITWTLGQRAGVQFISVVSELETHEGRANLDIGAVARPGPLARLSMPTITLAVGDSLPTSALAPSDVFGNVVSVASVAWSGVDQSIASANAVRIAGRVPGTTALVTSHGGTSITTPVIVQPFRVTRLQTPARLTTLGGTFAAPVGLELTTSPALGLWRRADTNWVVTTLPLTETMSITRSGDVWRIARGALPHTLHRLTPGGTWLNLPLPRSVTTVLLATGAGGDSVTVRAQDSLWTHDGNQWRSDPLPPELFVVVNGRERLEFQREFVTSSDYRLRATRVVGGSRTTLPPIDLAGVPSFSTTTGAASPAGAAFVLVQGSCIATSRSAVLAVGPSSLSIVAEQPGSQLCTAALSTWRSLFVTDDGAPVLRTVAGFEMRPAGGARQYVAPAGRTIETSAPDIGKRVMMSVTDWWGNALLLVEPL